MGAGWKRSGVEKVRTARVCAEYVANGFGVCTDTVDPRDKVTAVALEEDAVFGPVVVFVIFFPSALEEGVVLCFGVEHQSVNIVLVSVFRQWSGLVLTLHP